MPETVQVLPRSANELPPRRAAIHWNLLSGLVVLALGGLAAFSFPSLIPSGETTNSMKTHEVSRGDMLVTVTEEGNVESASNVEVKCRVAGGSSILWIVEDGSQVKTGDKLVELDSSALEEQISTQRIAYEQARALKLQSEKAFAVAKIAVTEYLEGTLRLAIQDTDALVTIAEENLRTAKNSLKQTRKMFQQGFVSSLDLEGAKFAVGRCDLELGSAETARDVLVNFTKEKMLEELRSLRDNAEAQMNSDAASFELEETRLERLEDQLSSCTILAPQDGMVVYANERSRRQQTVSIEEGAALREQQVILRLPDLDQMQVKVTVHESKVDQIQSGMRARVRILDRETTGTVTTIANQPESSSPFEGNVKKYATSVRLAQEDSANFRPGMTAEVEILIEHLNDALMVPVAAVVNQGDTYYAWVDSDSGPDKRSLVLGPSNDKVVEVKDGVAAGENVVLNPRAVIKEAREVVAAAEVDAETKFGTAIIN